MIIGALRSYLSNNDTFYYHVSHNFWNLIQGSYRYSTGGVGNGRNVQTALYPNSKYGHEWRI